MSQTQKVLDKYGELIVKTIQTAVRNAGKSNTGNLINELTYDHASINGVYTLFIKGVSYMKFVDSGRRAGTHKGSYIPIKPLIAWIKKKKIPVNIPIPKTKQTRQQAGISKEKAIRGMAFAISKSVFKRGYKNSVPAFPIYKIARKITSSNNFKKEITAAVIKDLANKIKLP